MKMVEKGGRFSYPSKKDCDKESVLSIINTCVVRFSLVEMSVPT